MELTRVLTHEFTHHYMYSRWAPGMHGGEAGYWVVEGMAEFVQYQMHKIDTRGLSFDDDTVYGNDLTAGARRVGLTSEYLRMERFIDMSQNAFKSLEDNKLLGQVPLRHAKGVVPVDERGLWYAQAGTLCYFFLVKKGPEMRKRFLEYVHRHYSNSVDGAPRPAWKFLGYESAEALDKDFLAFLKTVNG